MTAFLLMVALAVYYFGPTMIIKIKEIYPGLQEVTPGKTYIVDGLKYKTIVREEFSHQWLCSGPMPTRGTAHYSEEELKAGVSHKAV